MTANKQGQASFASDHPRINEMVAAAGSPEQMMKLEREGYTYDLDQKEWVHIKTKKLWKRPK